MFSLSLDSYPGKQGIQTDQISALGYQLAFNVYNHDSALLANGYNEEEMKMVHETRKIFSCQDIAITCTCVRVPVLRAHCESINLEFENPITPQQVTELLSTAPGVAILDDRENNRHPMPIDASGKDDVFVGRIRQDESIPDNRGINIWVAGDQLRKGAALNAVQIAEKDLEGFNTVMGYIQTLCDDYNPQNPDNIEVFWPQNIRHHSILFFLKDLQPSLLLRPVRI